MGKGLQTMFTTTEKASTIQAGGMIALLTTALWVVILAPIVA
ncbi:hypothetical protein [Sphingomonas crocodyli]|nr:hypothetical protein [Sphingomonas crocodyli]